MHVAPVLLSRLIVTPAAKPLEPDPTDRIFHEPRHRAQQRRRLQAFGDRLGRVAPMLERSSAWVFYFV